MGRLKNLVIGEFRVSLSRTALAMRPGRTVLIGHRMILRGASRIDTRGGRLELGLMFRGFADRRLGGLIRVRGRLRTHGVVKVAHGNRWDIGPCSTMTVGAGTYFSPSTLVVTMHGLEIGEDCAIGWNCHFLDENFHQMAGQQRERDPIVIGSHVWIGSGVTVLPGTCIADGCVIAANSTVKGQFTEPECLIGGTPARVLRKNIAWS